MKKELIIQLHKQFDAIVNVWPDSEIKLSKNIYERGVATITEYLTVHGFGMLKPKNLTTAEL